MESKNDVNKASGGDVRLRYCKPDIIACWRRRVLSDGSKAVIGTLCEPVLAKYMPALLDELILCLEVYEGNRDLQPGVEQTWVAAWEHEHGHNKPTLLAAISELSHLRAAFLETLDREYSLARVPLKAQLLVHEAVDRVIALVAEHGLAGRRDEAQAEGEVKPPAEHKSLPMQCFQAVFDEAVVGMILTDLEGRVVRTNRHYCELLGYTSDELRELTFHDVTHPDDAAANQACLERLFEGGRDSCVFQKRNLHKSGRAVWIEIAVSLLRTPDKTPDLLLGVVLDVTERRLAIDGLRASEERFRTLANAIPQLAWMGDAAGDLTWFNERWYTFTGASFEEDRGWGWAARIHPEHRQRVEQRIRHSWASGDEWDDTFPLQGTEGQWRWFLSRALPIKNADGQVVAWFGTNTDITEAREAAEKLKQSERYFRQLAEAMPQIVFTTTPEGEVDYLNKAWYRYGGIAPQESYGRGWARLIPPEDQAAVREAWQQSLAHGKACSVEHRLLRKDGAYRWHFCQAVPIYDDDGRLLRWLGTAMDTDDRRRAEDELRRASQVADAANLAKSVFLANMSHEIRTPLGALVGFGELLKEEQVPLEKQREYIDIIARNGKALSQLVDEVLDLSKVEAGEVALDLAPMSLTDLLGDVSCSLAPKAKEKGVAFILRRSEDTPDVIVSDVVRLRQILLNIVGNAIKFTDDGCITLSVVGRLQPQTAQHELAFIVQDTGIGISQEGAERLFHPFAQADWSTTRRFGGTGLGLALARKLARALGGDVVLSDSKPGAGSTFTITVDPGKGLAGTPTLSGYGAALPKEGQPTRPAIASDYLKGLSVLLAEDSPDNQQLIGRILRKVGACVELANNGQEAVDKALAAAYDVVLMDIQMPLLDGYGATLSLRSKGLQTPIIALTAHATLEERRKSLGAGCNDHLTKPLNQQRLIETVAQYGRHH